MEQVTSGVELEITAAERDVNDARAKLGSELEAVAQNGRQVLHKVAHQARPVLIGIAVVAGVAILAGTVRLVRDAMARPRLRRVSRGPAQPSIFAQAARSAVVSALGIVASSFARRAVRMIEHPDGDHQGSQSPSSAE